MATDCLIQNRNNTVGTSSNTSSVNGASKPASNLNVAAQGSNDTLTTGNTQGTQEAKKTKRSVEQLYQAIQALCTSNGIDFNEVKKMGLLSTVSGKSEAALLNAKEEEIKKIVDVLNQTIAAMKEDKIEINAQNLEKQARGYQIQLDCGWKSIESFRKSNKNNHESVIQRLNRFFGCDFTKLSTEQKAKKLDAYFNKYFNGADSKNTISQKQLTDFSKLLFNSSPEEKLVLKDAIEFLCANNRFKGLDSLLKSFDTQAERTEFANNVTHEEVTRWGIKPDKAGDLPSENEMTAITQVLVQNKDAQHVKEYHADAQKAREAFFTDENKAKLAEILKKVANKETLTEEEKELLQEAKFHTSDSAGEQIGVANNQVISDDFKTDMLHTMNEDAYKLPNYKEVLEQVNKYIEENPDRLNMSVEEFIKKMDEVTNGNFTTAVNASKNGTTPEFKEPVKRETSSSATTTSNKATSIEEVEVRRMNAENTKAKLYEQNSQEPEIIVTSASKTENKLPEKGINGIFYAKKLIKDVNDNVAVCAKELAEVITRLPEVVQTTFLQFTTGTAFNIILENASKKAILRTNGRGLSTYQSEILAERIKEIREDEEKKGLCFAHN